MTEAILIILCICAVAAVILIAVFMRRKIVFIARSIEDTVDQMIAGCFTAGSALYDDTLSAKINHKLKRLYEVMENQNDRTALQHKQIQELISDISHQVKTPVSNIKMINETLASGRLEGQKRAELQAQLDAQVDKLDSLIQSLIKSSRLETGAVTLSPQPLPLIETLAQAIGGVALFAENKGIDLSVDCDADIVAQHDKKWTAEALFNILDNAVKYTPARGSVTVSCEQWELYTKIDITDTGVGIAEEEQAQVFRRFYRAPSAQQKEGVGIGLYLAREIIQKQGGYIRLVSAPDEGSTFSIFLPHS